MSGDREARSRASAAAQGLREAEADRLAALFTAMGSRTRARIVHLLVVRGDAPAGEIARVLAMTPQAVSNQLGRLARAGIVASRRDGARVHYRVVNPCVPALLEKGLCLVRGQC